MAYLLADFLAVKLEAMHANLSQNVHRQGVVWTRTGEDGTEMKVNVWQHCKNEEERRNQRLYLAFQSRLRQQGRLGRSTAIKFDTDNEYDVQAFFEQAKIQLKKDYDHLNRLSKALLVIALICLAVRTTIAIVLCLQEMLEFANCQQAFWTDSKDPVLRSVEETWNETLPELTVAGSAGPNHNEEGIYCQVDGGAGCTSWYLGSQNATCSIGDDEVARALKNALGNCSALALGGALHSTCSTLYGACVNCEQACMSAVIEDTRDDWYLTMTIYLYLDHPVDGLGSAGQILLHWPCMISSLFCVLVTIPVCYKAGKHIACVKAKAQRASNQDIIMCLLLQYCCVIKQGSDTLWRQSIAYQTKSTALSRLIESKCTYGTATQHTKHHIWSAIL